MRDEITVIANYEESEQMPRAHATWTEGQHSIIVAWHGLQFSCSLEQAQTLHAALNKAIVECMVTTS